MVLEKTPGATYIDSDDQSLVEYKKEGRVGIIELTNNRKMNTYSHAFFQQMEKAVLEARFDNEVSIILIRNRDRGAFSAGAEISYLSACNRVSKSNFCLHGNETLLMLEQTPKLVIASLDGHAVGGGLEIALAADIRIMSSTGVERDHKIGLPEVSLGVLPGTGGTQRLCRVVGNSRAIDLMVTGRLLGPNEALDMGLVNYVHHIDEFDAKVQEYVDQLANGPGLAIGLIKRAVVSGSQMSLHEGLTLERELQNRLFASDDAQEGIQAYLERRKPDFSKKEI
ncbi:MAG: enoyl-CoA hydratase/isomerase family protein [Candidatus Kariarchaeaceae archaeon]|jgi:enoyl-CoA hydratase/carnithine racemase